MQYPLASLCACLAATTPQPVQAQAPTSGFDPARAARLRAAFPKVDQTFRDFAVREHIPGAAWAIVIDGKVAHIGVTGLRDVAEKSPVDADTVFRIASMTKSFTAMAILQLRDEGKLSLDDPAEQYVPELTALRVSDHRFAADHDPSPAVACRRVPRGQPVGRPAARATPTSEMAAMMRRGIPFSNAPGIAYEYSNYGFAILGRIVSERVGHAVPRLHREQHPRAAGDDVDDARAGGGAAGRLAHGYRWEDEQWKEEPQLPDGAFGAMGGMLTSRERPGARTSRRSSARGRRATARRPAPVRRASLREMQQICAAAARPSVARGATARSSSTPAATASGSASRRTASSRTSSRTAAGCRASAR